MKYKIEFMLCGSGYEYNRLPCRRGMGLGEAQKTDQTIHYTATSSFSFANKSPLQQYLASTLGP